MTRSAKVESFGGFLRVLRKREQITQRDLGIATGYSESQISRFEKSHRPPDLSTLIALFVPALSLQDAPNDVARLCELAASARGELAQLAQTVVRGEVANAPKMTDTRDHDEAEWAALADGDYLKAAEIYANSGDLKAAVDMLYGRGVLLFNTGKSEAALSLIDGLLKQLVNRASHNTLRASLLATRGDLLVNSSRAAEAEGNFREALALTTGAPHAMLVQRLGGCLVQRGQSAEALALARRELDEVSPKHVFIRANLKIIEASALMMLSEFDQAEQANQEVLTLAKRLAETAPELVHSLRARSHNALGAVNAMRQNQLGALHHWRDAATAAREANLTQLEYRCMGNIGNVLFEQGDLDGALQACDHALAGLRGLGDDAAASRFLQLRITLLYVRGELDAARALSHESIALREKLGDTNGRINARNQLARIDLLTKRPAEALALLLENAATARALGEQRVLGYTLTALCDAELQLDDHAGAAAAIAEAQTLEKALHSDATLRDDVQHHAVLVHCAAGEIHAAEKALAGASPIASSMEMRIERELTRAVLARASGHADQAAIYTNTARDIAERAGYFVYRTLPGHWTR